MLNNPTQLRVLFVTSQWPTADHPAHSPFVKREVQSLRRIGMQVDVFHYQGGWSPLAYARATRRFHRELRSEPYDLVHVRFGQCGIIALTQRRLPVVARFGGSDLLGWRDNNGREPLASKLLRTVSRLVACRATEVIIVSETMADWLPKRDYHVIPSGIDLSHFRPLDQAESRARLGLDVGRKLVLFAADPARRVKRFDLAQESVALLKPLLDVDLVVTKQVSHAEMPLYMNACDVLLLTSDQEGSPNVVKEALACNLPVVTVDVGDVRQWLTNLPGCFVCQDRQAATLAADLKQALSMNRPSVLRAGILILDANLTAERVVNVYHQALN